MARIIYNTFLGLENDLFHPEIDSTNSVQEYPIGVYHSNKEKYSIVQKEEIDLNQPDLKVTIFDVINLPRSTRVHCNSSKIWASDVQFNSIYYYFKFPIPTGVTNVYVDEVLSTNVDSNFVYFLDDSVHEIRFDSIVVSNVKPYPVFNSRDYLDINFADNKTFSLAVDRSSLLVTYNKPNVNVFEPNKSIFDCQIIDDVTAQYDPFYLVFQNRVYDYSKITSVKVGSLYTYNNHFNFLGSFIETDYPYFDILIGFSNTGVITKTYYVDGLNVMNPTTDNTILFGRTSISKNLVSVDYIFENHKASFIQSPDLVQTRIKSIDPITRLYVEPTPIYLSGDHKPQNFAAIPGQLEYKNLDPFCLINGYRVDRKTFKFDISPYKYLIDPTTGYLASGFVLDYSTNTPITNYFQMFKAQLESKLNYPFDLDKIYLFGSSDGVNFVFIDHYNYSRSVNSDLTEYTARFNTNIYNTFDYLSIGFLFDGNKQLVSTETIEL